MGSRAPVKSWKSTWVYIVGTNAVPKALTPETLHEIGTYLRLPLPCLLTHSVFSLPTEAFEITGPLLKSGLQNFTLVTVEIPVF